VGVFLRLAKNILSFFDPLALRSRIRAHGFRSLKVKLIVASSTLVVGILVVTYLLLSRGIEELASEQAERRAVKLAESFSTTMAESVAARDRMHMHLFAETILGQGVEAVTVAAADGKVLYRSDKRFKTNGLAPSSNLKSYERGLLGTVEMDGERFLQTVHLLRFSKRTVGMLYMWLNLTELEAELRAQHAFIYPIFTGGFLLMIALCMGVLASPFRVLKRLTAVAERIGEGDLSIRVPVEGNDEMAHFSSVFNRMVERFSRARAEITRQHLETIKTMVCVVEAKDAYTRGHCLRVHNLTKDILETFDDLSAEEKSRILTAALLHDIGKIGVPDAVLLKKSPLTPEQMQVIRDHVTIGERILLHLDAMKEIAVWVRHHHEHWDGSGYPDGLRGEAIPLASRIIAVADAVDAMGSDRPYRKAYSMERIVKILREERGKQFDSAVVDRALSVLKAERSEEIEGSEELELSEICTVAESSSSE